MSNTIDEKVVEMKFDNKNFESNVKTTMSTLDKLKEKLNMRGSEQSFDAINNAAKSVSFDGLIENVEYLRKRFSVMGIAGMQVIQNITNTVMSSVKQAKNFVEQAITGGGLSRAMKLDEANFKLMGLLQDDAKQVSAIMDDVDYGVSGTAYSLDAAAGVAAQLAASGMRAGEGMQHALRGISGVAAMTGSTYEDIGRIYTQIAGQGRMMGDQLLQLSGRGMNAAATLAKYLNTTEAEVRDMVSKGKIDFQTFANIMDQEYGEHAKKANETFNGALANVKSALAKIGANFYKPLIEQNGPLVKLLNSVRLKINDIKEITLPFVETASKSVAKLINYVNKLVEKINVKNLFSGLTSKWDNLMNKIGEAGVSEDKFTEKLKEVAKEQGINIDSLLKKYGSLANIFAKGKLSGGLIIDTLKRLANVTSKASESTQDITDKVEYFNDVVSRTIRGDFGNGEERVKALTAANYDYAQVQALVNKVWERNGKNWSNCTLSAEEMTEAMANLSDKEAESIGLTKDQIKTLRELAKQAEETGTPMSELIASLNKPSGKELLLESFQNAAKGATQVAKAFREAFSEMFTSKDSSGESTLYKIIESINKFSQHLVMSDEKADKLKRTLKGLFAVIDMITNLIGGGLKLAFKVVNALLKYFNLDILTVTAYIGDFLVKLRDATDVSKLFTKALDKISPYLKNTANAIKEWIAGLKETDNIPKYIIEGFVNGIKSGGKLAIDSIINLGKKLIDNFKDILGIHSPSWKAFEIAMYFCQGAINGFKKFGKFVLEAVKSLGQSILSTAKGIDFGKVLAVTLGAGMLYVTNNVTKAVVAFSNAVSAIAAPAKGLGKLLESAGGFFKTLGDSVKKYLKAKEIEVVAKSVLTLALAVGVLAGSLWVVSKIDDDKLWSSVTAIGALTGIVAGLAAVVSALGKVGGGGKGALTVVGICAGLLIAVIALKKMQDLDPEKLTPVVDTLADLLIKLGIVCGVLMVVSNLAKGADKAGSLLLKMSASLVIIAVAIKILAGLKPEGVVVGMIVIELLQGFFIKMVAVSYFAGEHADKAGKMLLKMSIAMAIMVGVIKLASGLRGDEVLSGIATIGLIELLFAAMIVVSKVAGENGTKAGTMLLQMGIAIGILVGVIKLITYLKDDEIKRGLKVIGTLEAMFAALIAVSLFAGKNAAKAGAMLLMVSGAMLIMTGVIFIITQIDPSALPRAMVVVSILEALMGGLMYVSKNAAGVEKGTIIALTVAIGVLVGALIGLTFIKTEKLVPAVAGLTTVMLGFAAMMAAMKNVKTDKGTMKNILAMTGIVAILGGIVTAMSHLSNADSAIGNAAALSLLLISLSTAFFIMGKSGRISKTVTDNLYTMVSVIGVLALILTAMAVWDIQASIPNAIAIGVLLNLMATSFVIMGKSGRISKTVTDNLYKMVGVVSILAVVLSVMAALNIQASIPNAIAIGVLINAMASAMLILGQIKKIPDGAVTAMLAMTLVVAALGVVLGLLNSVDMNASLPNVIALSVMINAMAAAMLILGQIETDAGSILKSVLCMAALGLVVGELGFILGELNKHDLNASIETATALSVLILAMSASMILLAIAGTGAVSAVAGVTALIAVITELGLFAAAIGALMTEFPEIQDLLDTGLPIIEELATSLGRIFGDVIAGVLSGISDALPEIGRNLSLFGVSLLPLITTLNMIDSSAMDGAKSLAEALLYITAANLLDNLSKFIGGEKLDYDELKTQFEKFGDAIVAFSDKVKGKVDGDSVQVAADAGKVIAELEKSIPRSGGWAQKIMGEADMEKFSKGITKFGEAIVDFSAAVSEDGAIDKTAIENAASCGKIMTELNDNVPKSGGIWQKFTGENTLSGFGTNLKEFGSALVEFSNIVSGKTEAGSIDKKAVDKAKNVGDMLVQLNQAVPEQGGFMSWITGSTSLDDFGDNIVSFGKSLADFSGKVDGKISDDAVKAADNAGQMVVNLQKQISGMKDDDFDCLDSLGSALESWGTHISNYSANISGIDTDQLSTVTDEISTLYSFIEKMTTFDASGLSQFTSSLNNMGTISLDSFVNSFGDAGSKASSTITSFIDNMVNKVDNKKKKWETAGTNAMTAYIRGISNKSGSVSSTVESTIESSVNKASLYRSNFYNTGKYLMEGMRDGIDDNADKAVNAVRKMAKRLPQIARIVLQIHSPSKVFDSLGEYLPEGMARGVNRGSSKVYRAVGDMSNTLIDSASSIMTAITDTMNMNLDYSPTITPVVDMGNVTNSMSAINSMLNRNPLVFSGLNIGSVNAVMQRRQNQNGNDDVINAIDRLSNKINQTPGNIYNVNGITYDDGSNIAKAIEQIVRAATIERRA